MSNTFLDLKESIEYWSESAILDFTEQLARTMKEQDVSRAELARRIGTSSAYITKTLSGEANFTLTTMTKFALALDSFISVSFVPRASATSFSLVTVPADRTITPYSLAVDQAA